MLRPLRLDFGERPRRRPETAKVELGAGAAAIGVWLLAATALADTTVHLNSGGMIRGELMESLPGEHVSLRLADGTVRTVAWEQVARVVNEQAPAAAPAPAPAPATRSTGGTPRGTRLELEIEQLRTERESISNGGPAVMMVLGGLGFLIFAPAGLVLLAAGELCDDVNDTTDGSASTVTRTDCTDVGTTGAVLTVIGLGSGAIGIWGLVLALDNSSRRRELDQRIREKQREQGGLAFGVAPYRDGAALRLRLRF